MARKVCARIARVAGNRRLEGFEAVVFLLLTQFLEETHAQVGAVKLPVPVENVNLEQRQRHRIHGGPPPQARDPSPQALDLDSEDSGKGRRAPQRDVRRGKAEAASELRAVGDRKSVV